MSTKMGLHQGHIRRRAPMCAAICQPCVLHCSRLLLLRLKTKEAMIHFINPTWKEMVYLSAHHV